MLIHMQASNEGVSNYVKQILTIYRGDRRPTTSSSDKSVRLEMDKKDFPPYFP